MTAIEVYNEIHALAPTELAASWDKVGFLTGRRGADVSKLLCALDITAEVIAEAAEWGAQMILSHHPLFFTLETVTDATAEGELLLTLAENGIAAVCMHTNLDAASGGVNDALALRLGLENIAPFCRDGCGRSGTLSVPEGVSEFASRCKKALKSGVVRFYDAGRPVKRVCVASGSGFAEFPEALESGADTFVSGDIKMSGFLAARHHKINLLDCGHYATEVTVFDTLIPALAARMPGVEIRLSERQGEPFSVCL
ncbi:MAG: Nif3-like dinuclear metal center hexameric protein [Oscillospiraceae bacterium]|jgi:dinuclear metal center YbgI/SA1388 family protein|nr:Nif3-like dinuclear metal center hexameric protein [Oscillospiraceae bacterium]